MKFTTLKYLTQFFPDAVLITEGLDHGKYETENYLFHIDCEFYTSKLTRKTCFLGSKTWKQTFEELKDLDLRYKNERTNLIGKE